MINLSIDEFTADYTEYCVKYFAIFRRDIYSNDLIMVYKEHLTLGYVDCIRLSQLGVYKLLKQGAITNIKII